jgi:hypothetical protein
MWVAILVRNSLQAPTLSIPAAIQILLHQVGHAVLNERLTIVGQEQMTAVIALYELRANFQLIFLDPRTGTLAYCLFPNVQHSLIPYKTRAEVVIR